LWNGTKDGVKFDFKFVYKIKTVFKFAYWFKVNFKTCVGNDGFLLVFCNYDDTTFKENSKLSSIFIA